jgi:hypothetical protein
MYYATKKAKISLEARKTKADSSEHDIPLSRKIPRFKQTKSVF